MADYKVLVKRITGDIVNIKAAPATFSDKEINLFDVEDFTGTQEDADDLGSELNDADPDSNDILLLGAKFVYDFNVNDFVEVDYFG